MQLGNLFDAVCAHVSAELLPLPGYAGKNSSNEASKPMITAATADIGTVAELLPNDGA